MVLAGRAQMGSIKVEQGYSEYGIDFSCCSFEFKLHSNKLVSNL